MENAKIEVLDRERILICKNGQLHILLLYYSGGYTMSIQSMQLISLKNRL